MLPPSPLPTSCAMILPKPQFPHSQEPPQESTGPEVSGPTGQATVSAPSAVTPAPESDILAYMQPLRIQLGGAKWVYQCQVEGCKEGPSTSQAAVYAHIRKVHLGVGLVCPLCSKTFFNPDVFRHHKKLIIKNFFLVTSGVKGSKSSKFTQCMYNHCCFFFISSVNSLSASL